MKKKDALKTMDIMETKAPMADEQLPDGDASHPKKIGWWSYLSIPLSIIITAFIFLKILMLSMVPTESMYPTFHKGAFVISSRLDAGKEQERGDIIIFTSKEQGVLLVKRIIGCPGETLTITNGQVYINGNILDESDYIAPGATTYGSMTVDIPPGCYFVMGDNREDSYDSRFWVNPCVSKEDVVGVHSFELYLPIICPAIGSLLD